MVRKTMCYWDDSMNLNGTLHDELVICLTFYFSCISYFVWLCFFFFVLFKCFSSQPMCDIKHFFFLQLLNAFLYRAFENLFFMPLGIQLFVKNICFGSVEIWSIMCGKRSMTYTLYPILLPVHHLDINCILCESQGIQRFV